MNVNKKKKQTVARNKNKEKEENKSSGNHLNRLVEDKATSQPTQD
jgi:hypothetical protein